MLFSQNRVHIMCTFWLQNRLAAGLTETPAGDREGKEDTEMWGKLISWLMVKICLSVLKTFRKNLNM